MSDLTAVSLFAGIGGIDKALEAAGARVVAAVEIDPACRGVLARHFPQTALFSDVTEVTGDQLRAAGFVPGRGVLAAGWPCTGNSIAGRRAGMADPRSGLWVHVGRLLAELRPRWFLGENVPGLYSVNDGRDIAVVRGDLAQLGYWWAERTLDAQHFGVPQRRRRVFFAGCLGERAAPVQVLFEPEGSTGDSAPGGEPGTGAARGAANGAGSPSRKIAQSLTANYGKQPDNSDTNLGPTLVVATLQGGGRRGHRVDAEGAAGGHLLAVPVALRGRAEGSRVEFGEDGDPAFTVRTPGGGSSYPMIAHALTSEGFDASEDGTGRSTPIVPIGVPQVHPHAARLPVEAHAFNWQTGGVGMLGYGDKPTALQASQVTAVQSATAVRRLTPRECERLQGFPDDWTRYLADGTEQSDSARYRQCGNAVAVPVVEWIAHRLVATDAASSDTEPAA